MLGEAVRKPVIASGGAGAPSHLYDVLTEGRADAALVAPMVHFGDYTVSGLNGTSRTRREGPHVLVRGG